MNPRLTVLWLAAWHGISSLLIHAAPKSATTQVCGTPSAHLEASPSSVEAGQAATLRWTSQNAERLELSGVGEVRGESVSVSPSCCGNTSYELVAVNGCDQKSGPSRASIHVSEPPPPPPPPPAYDYYDDFYNYSPPGPQVQELGKVYLVGTRYESYDSAGDYAKGWANFANSVQNELPPWAQQALGAQSADASARSGLQGLAGAINQWPPSAEVFNQAQVAGQAYIVNEKGDVLGNVSTSLVLNTGLPGMSYLGDPVAMSGVQYPIQSMAYTGNMSIGISDGVTQLNMEVQGFMSVSPILLDLDGNDKPDVDRGEWLPHPGRFNQSRSRLFDINGDGFPDVTEWVGPGDGLLVFRVPKGQEVRGGGQLFGNPIGFVDGYQKLGLYFDTDRNGVVEGKELEGLIVWQDRDGNARSGPGELTPASELGITAIQTSHKNLKSSYVVRGEERATWDWWPTAMLVYPSLTARVPRPK